MKGFDDKGIVWYTNYESRKSQEMTDNPYAAATFWWGPLERSIRIEGQVEKVRLTMRHAVLLC
jgi:pyridoxamine 5'-phosphate oxidase